MVEDGMGDKEIGSQSICLGSTNRLYSMVPTVHQYCPHNSRTVNRQAAGSPSG